MSILLSAYLYMPKSPISRLINCKFLESRGLVCVPPYSVLYIPRCEILNKEPKEVLTEKVTLCKLKLGDWGCGGGGS